MRKSIFVLGAIGIVLCSSSCAEESDPPVIEAETEQAESYEQGHALLGGDPVADESGVPETETGQRKDHDKGYDLPIDDAEKEEAERECDEIMGRIKDIYAESDKGGDINTVVSDETILRMKGAIKDTGVPVIDPGQYPMMENHQEMDRFLEESGQGRAGEAVLYEIGQDGGIRRKKYIFDGSDMYLLSARAQWDEGDEPMVTSFSHTRLKEWDYTEKGWFFYELCVPEPPEVTEVVDGSCAVRVKPLSDEYRALSEKYTWPLGYQGNNLLCSDWDTENMEGLDYNGMYEFLYQMRYQERFRQEEHPDGIPAERFEEVVMGYLPVTAEQIREWAVFDEGHQTYKWTGMGCTTYVLSYFVRSVPEVTDVRENADGTVTLRVEAVCDKEGDDAILVHELTVKTQEDGGFIYMGNKILDSGLEGIPPYQYRVR